MEEPRRPDHEIVLTRSGSPGRPGESSRAAVVARAAADASSLAAHAAETARRTRDAAVRVADEIVADRARQEAVATRYRAEAAATRVLRAADVAAAVARRAEADPQGVGARRRAARIVDTARIAALALAEEDAALARAVERTVATTAGLHAAARSALHLAIDAETAETAAALDLRVTADAATAAAVTGS